MSEASSPDELSVQLLGVSWAELTLYTSHHRSGQALLLAGINLIIYDWFLTWSDERQFVWKSHNIFSGANILFFLNRYLPLITLSARIIALYPDVFNKKVCNYAMLAFSGYAGIVNFGISEIVLLLRVWVLYEKSIFIGSLLCGVYVIAFVVAIVLKQVQPQTSLPFVSPLPMTLTICKRSRPSELFWLFGVGFLVELFAFSLLVWKAWTFSRNSAQATIIRTLLRQGALYYSVVLMMLLVTIISPMVEAMYQPIADATFVLPIASIACSRLVLSLRGMYFARSSLRDPGEFIAAPRETAIDYDKAETNDFELHDRAIHSRQP